LATTHRGGWVGVGKPEKGNASAKAQPWLAVDVFGSPQAVATSGGVSVRIGSAVIELQPGFDPSVLRAVVSALEAPRC
jgi:hypothetical protein